jgi:hypothetical protein
MMMVSPKYKWQVELDLCLYMKACGGFGGKASNHS